MKYTLNKKADVIIHNILTKCQNIILSFCSPQTILLAGSYARGEGMVVTQQGELKFISDIDIYIFGNRFIKKSLKKASDQIQQQIKNIEVNIQYMDVNSQHDDLSAIDLKYQTKLLYGEPIHKNIKINETRALKTAIRFLMSKSKYLLLIDKNTTKKEIIDICSRTYAEIATVLCCKAGIYKITYLERCNTIKKIRFSMVNRDILDRISRFTRHKLGYKENFKEGKLKIYRQTIFDLFTIWSLILKIPKSEVANGTKIFQNNLKEAFFGPYIEEVFERIFGIATPPAKSLWINLAQIYDYIPFLFIQLRNKNQNVYIPPVASPYIWIYSRITNSLNKPYPEKNEALARLWDLNAHRRYHF